MKKIFMVPACILFLLSACDNSQNGFENQIEPKIIAAEKDRPNMIVILVDDMRFDEMGVAGHPYIQTPNIDRIADEGIQFTNSFTVNPLCSPSRATLLTGQHAHYHGITDNLARNEQSHKLETFPIRLQESGYDTAFIGKWHMGNDDTPRPGFTKWVGMRGQGEALNPGFNIDGKRQVVEGYVTDILHEQAIDFIKTDRENPFMLYLSHKALHPNVFQADDGSAEDLPEGQTRSGFIAADRHVGMYKSAEPPRRPNFGVTPNDKPALMRQINDLPKLGADTVTSNKTIHERHEMLMAIDEGVGSMLDELASIGKLDNTLIVFTSDHGYWYGEHGLNAERRLAYEEGIRIPLLMRYPKAIKAGSKAEQVVLTLDLAPTLIEMAGLGIEKARHGRSYKHILEGKPVNEWRNSFMIEYYSDTVFERMDKMGYKAVRTDQYKYIRYEDQQGMDELYDLKADPYELKNIIFDENSDEIVQRMDEELNRLIDISSR